MLTCDVMMDYAEPEASHNIREPISGSNKPYATVTVANIKQGAISDHVRFFSESPDLLDSIAAEFTKAAAALRVEIAKVPIDPNLAGLLADDRE